MPAGYVRFGLVEPNTWWKSVTVFAGDKFDYELVAVQDCPGVIKYADVPIPNLAIFNYVLSKAKSLGTHQDITGLRMSPTWRSNALTFLSGLKTELD